MFAVVRTGGKQYRVAPGDKIVVEKLDGNAGDKITLGDVLLAGEGSSLKSTDGLTVAAEIIAQAKADKVTVFKKRRRHNYRRKKGHRQQHTILKIVAIGDHKEAKKAAPKAEAKPAAPQPATEKPVAHAKAKAEAETDQQKAGDIVGTPTESPAPSDDKAAGAKKPAAKKAAASKPKAAAKKPAAKKPASKSSAAKKGKKK